MHRRALTVILVIAVVVFSWLLFIGLPRYAASKPAPPTPGPQATVPTPAAGPATAARKITATLFYVGDDGLTLVGAPREVDFADGVAPQARAIIEAQLGPAAPRVSAIPADTRLRDVFVTERGDAFVDLSVEVSTHHSGGALDELLTIYTIVDALTVNLPAITRVQILIDGKEVETLAGHVDLRHPLAKSLQWVAHDTH
jgi:spore germination protein GerM